MARGGIVADRETGAATCFALGLASGIMLDPFACPADRNPLGRHGCGSSDASAL
jgi:hypothetical protein